MTRLLVVLLLASVAGCSASGGSLDVSVTTPLARGQVGTVKVTARDGAGAIGKGSVKVKSDSGSLSAAQTLTLDAFGTADVEYSCDVALDAACAGDRAKIDVTWLPANATTPIEGSTTVRFIDPDAGGGTGGGSGGGGGSGAGGGAPDYAGYANGMYFDGVDGGSIFQGRMLVTQGTIFANFPYGGGWEGTGATWPSLVAVVVNPTSASQGSYWFLTFASPLGTNFDVGNYQDPQTPTLRDAGRSGLDISGDGRACNGVAGHFEVLDFARSGDGGVASLTITFTQYCDGSMANRLSGWVRVGH